MSEVRAYSLVTNCTWLLLSILWYRSSTSSSVTVQGSQSSWPGGGLWLRRSAYSPRHQAATWARGWVAAQSARASWRHSCWAV
uniref:Putative secreted protein n=1 Tax=Ixodes ricinus TaxID=34613 RepID=A0A6B0U7W4_IXORI